MAENQFYVIFTRRPRPKISFLQFERFGRGRKSVLCNLSVSAVAEMQIYAKFYSSAMAETLFFTISEFRPRPKINIFHFKHLHNGQ